ncbi:MAG: protein-disulfide reductase DsbD N-terminal domain-containing protein [Bacillota bacterium]
MQINQRCASFLLALCALGWSAHALAQQSPAPGLQGKLAGVFSSSKEEALLEPDEAFKLKVSAKSGGAVAAELVPANGYYLYKERIRFTLKSGDVAIRTVKLPAGELKNDLILGRTEVYKKAVPVEIALDKGTKGKAVTLVASYQGCQEKLGVCYPPIEKSVNLVLP